MTLHLVTYCHSHRTFIQRPIKKDYSEALEKRKGQINKERREENEKEKKEKERTIEERKEKDEKQEKEKGEDK